MYARTCTVQVQYQFSFLVTVGTYQGQPAKEYCMKVKNVTVALPLLSNGELNSAR